MMTERQRNIYEFIVSFRDRVGVTPTYREIASAFFIRSTNGVMKHLKALERKGYIEITPYQARGISVVVK